VCRGVHAQVQESRSDARSVLQLVLPGEAGRQKGTVLHASHMPCWRPPPRGGVPNRPCCAPEMRARKRGAEAQPVAAKCYARHAMGCARQQPQCREGGAVRYGGAACRRGRRVQRTACHAPLRVAARGGSQPSACACYSQLRGAIVFQQCSSHEKGEMAGEFDRRCWIMSMPARPRQQASSTSRGAACGVCGAVRVKACAGKWWWCVV